MLKNKHRLKLIDPNKKGTVILGNYRTGSHFISKLTVEAAKSIGLVATELEEHMAYDANICLEFVQLDCSTNYLIVIINHADLKIGLLNNPNLLKDWHVIRTTDQDLHRWFLSYHVMMNRNSDLAIKAPSAADHFFTTFRIQSARLNGRLVQFYGNSDQGVYFDTENNQYLFSWNREQDQFINPTLKSVRLNPDTIHNTWKKVYPTMKFDEYPTDQVAKAMLDTFLSSYRPATLDSNLFREISMILCGMRASMDIAVDEEIDWTNMHWLASENTAWMPTDYLVSRVPLQSLWTNGDFLVGFLESFDLPKTGRLR